MLHKLLNIMDITFLTQHTVPTAQCASAGGSFNSAVTRTVYRKSFLLTTKTQYKDSPLSRDRIPCIQIITHRIWQNRNHNFILLCLYHYCVMKIASATKQSTLGHEKPLSMPVRLHQSFEKSLHSRTPQTQTTVLSSALKSVRIFFFLSPFLNSVSF